MMSDAIGWQVQGERFLNSLNNIGIITHKKMDKEEERLSN